LLSFKSRPLVNVVRAR